MFKNIWYNQKTSTIHLWSNVEGFDKYEEIYWVPYVFVKTDSSKIKNIEGEPVAKKTFNNYFTYKKFADNNFDVYENNVRPEIQFLVEKYGLIPDDELTSPKLKTYFLDIEVLSEKGFPKAIYAEWPIGLISLYDNSSKKTITWSLYEYNGKFNNKKNYDIKVFPNEQQLLLDFIEFMNSNPPDVISGWNCYFFDIAYILNRVQNILSKHDRNRLSPVNNIRTWTGNKGDMQFDIAGTTVLDYMDLYKQYNRQMQENYKLDFIAEIELGKKKLDYSEYESIRDFWKNDWDKFVDYNIMDAQLVHEIDVKRGFINIAYVICAYAKCPLKYYNATTQLNEGVILTHLRRTNRCAPPFKTGSVREYEAGYVKQPQLGFFKWVVDFDIASSYPHQMMILNMSAETYVGKIEGFTEDQILSFIRDKKFPEFTFNILNKGTRQIKGKTLEAFNKAVECQRYAIAPIGVVFKTDPLGLLAEVQKNGFEKRTKVKAKMIKVKDSATNAPEENKEELKAEEKRLFNLQYSIKIVINSLYGACATKYSRYSNIHIAEAITSCGRHSIRSGERYANDFLNNPDEDLISILEELKDYATIKGK